MVSCDLFMPHGEFLLPNFQKYMLLWWLGSTTDDTVTQLALYSKNKFLENNTIQYMISLDTRLWSQMFSIRAEKCKVFHING